MQWFVALKAFTNSPLWIGGVFAVPLVSMAIFALQNRGRRRPRSERVLKAGGSALLSQWVMEYGYWWLGPQARLLVRLQVAPNTITLVGFGVVLLGVALTALGAWGLAGLFILGGSLADMLDGLVARERNLCSDAGEYVDAMVDRYADIALFAGLCLYYRGRPWILVLIMLALLGSIMVSYARAKAESLGVHDAPGGPMRRAERAVYLGFSIMLSPLVARLVEPTASTPQYHLTVVTCALIAVLANVSAVQMTAFVCQKLARPAP